MIVIRDCSMILNTNNKFYKLCGINDMFDSLVDIWSKNNFIDWLDWNEHLINYGRGFQLFRNELWHYYYARKFHLLFLKYYWSNILDSYLRNMPQVNFRIAQFFCFFVLHYNISFWANLY